MYIVLNEVNVFAYYMSFEMNYLWTFLLFGAA